MGSLREFALGHSKTITQDAYPVSRSTVTRLSRVLNLEAREGDVIDNGDNFSLHGHIFILLTELNQLNLYS